MRIIIIGSGLAGQLVLRDLRAQGDQPEIILISMSEGAFYSKPSLSNVFTQKKLPKDLKMMSKEEVEDKFQCQILANTTVSSVDESTQVVHTEGGSYAYDRLVLAMGAMPIEPEWLSISGNVYRVNQLEDYEQFYPVITKDKVITIIGGGLIGVEFAHDIAPFCQEVILIEKMPTLMATMLPKEIGTALAKSLETRGVRVLTNATVAAIDDQEEFVEVTVDGQVLRCDAVLAAIGIRPDIELAQSMGLETNMGVVVNHYGETSDPRIYALGDCAEVCGLVKNYVAPLKICASVIAKNILGEREKIVYPPMPVMLKTPSYPICFCYKSFPVEWKVAVTEEGVEALAYEKDTLVGFALSQKQIMKRTQYKEVMASWIGD